MTKKITRARSTFARRATIRFTEEEYLYLSSAAERYGVTLADLIRTVLANRKIKIPEAVKYDYKSINQLRQLGGLLKKHYTDTGGEHREITKDILENINRVIEALLKEIK